MTRMASLQCSVRALSHLSLVFGLLACGTLSLAVSTDFWLHTSENLDASSSTGISGVNDTNAAADADLTVVVAANMHSGLWRSCTSFDYEMQDYEDDFFPLCTNIVYFGQDSERPEKAETTTSILRAIRKASPVIVGSLLVMLTALALSILGSSKRDVRTLMAAILYICAGQVITIRFFL